MTKTEVKNFRSDFENAVAQLEKKYGAKISLGTIRFDEGGLRGTMKLEKGVSTERLSKDSFKVGDIVGINHKKVGSSRKFKVIKIMSKNVKVVDVDGYQEYRVSPSLLVK